MITTAVFVGQIVGNFIWGPIADKYGRRFAFLRSATTICVFSWLSGVSPNYASLLLFRTFCGVGIGGSSVPFDLVAEFLPSEARGASLLSMEFLWTFGSLIVIGTAWIFLASDGWRPLVFITATPMTVVVVVAIFSSGVSSVACLKGRYAEAERIVRKCAETNDTLLEPFSFGHGVRALLVVWLIRLTQTQCMGPETDTRPNDVHPLPNRDLGPSEELMTIFDHRDASGAPPRFYLGTRRRHESRIRHVVSRRYPIVYNSLQTVSQYSRNMVGSMYTSDSRPFCGVEEKCWIGFERP